MSVDAGKLFIPGMPDQRLPILQHGHRLGQLARHALSLMSVRVVVGGKHMPVMMAKAKNAFPGQRNDGSDGRALNGEPDMDSDMIDATETTNVTPRKEVSGPDIKNPTTRPASNVALSSSDPVDSADETAPRREGALHVNLRSDLDAQGANTDDLAAIPGQTVKTPRPSGASNGAGGRDAMRASNDLPNLTTARSHVIEDEHMETGAGHGDRLVEPTPVHPSMAEARGQPQGMEGNALAWMRRVDRHGLQHPRQPNGGVTDHDQSWTSARAEHCTVLGLDHRHHDRVHVDL